MAAEFAALLRIAGNRLAADHLDAGFREAAHAILGFAAAITGLDPVAIAERRVSLALGWVPCPGRHSQLDPTWADSPWAARCGRPCRACGAAV